MFEEFYNKAYQICLGFIVKSRFILALQLAVYSFSMIIFIYVKYENLVNNVYIFEHIYNVDIRL
jgi:hypothetical protein